MDLGDRRVVIGFSPEAPVVALEGRDMAVFRPVTVASTLRVPSAFPATAGDVVAAIARQRDSLAVLEGAVAASNISDRAIVPAEAFDRASEPLDAGRGGTGLSNVPDGLLLVGAGTSPAVPTDRISFSGGVLETPSLTVGDWRFEPGDDEFGRRTVFARDAATGRSVNLVSAGRREVAAPALAVAAGAMGQVTLAASVPPGSLVRLVHFHWRPVPSDPATPAQVARGSPRASVLVDPDGGARYTVTGLAAGTAYTFMAAAEDGRGNVSPVTDAVSETLLA
eukprot:jgi/Tetstr1/454152/TSEL_041071.t1